jgi:hypothetical protein
MNGLQMAINDDVPAAKKLSFTPPPGNMSYKRQRNSDLDVHGGIRNGFPSPQLTLATSPMQSKQAASKPRRYKFKPNKSVLPKVNYLIFRVMIM